jgi:peroxiredoxin Q/BCP
MPIPVDGDIAPDFDLPTAAGPTFRLSAHRGNPVVLFFYAEDDTEGCTIENQEFSALLPDFAALGVAVAGISEDSLDKHRKFCGKYRLEVTLIADPGHVAIERYGVWGPKVTFGHHLIGLIRTTFLIGPNGRVLASWRVTRIRGHAAKVLASARELLGKG